MHIGGRIAVVETDEVGIGVDVPEDVEKVEALMKKQK
jgi:CMP-2-keto-3-deoxyoctulosonic acid synthetase